MKTRTNKVSLTIKPEVWRAFREGCARAGMSPSRAVEIYMACMVSDTPLDALKKNVAVLDLIKAELYKGGI